MTLKDLVYTALIATAIVLSLFALSFPRPVVETIRHEGHLFIRCSGSLTHHPDCPCILDELPKLLPPIPELPKLDDVLPADRAPTLQRF